MKQLPIYACIALAACSKPAPEKDPEPVPPRPIATLKDDGRPVIVTFGDSLSAGHGAPSGQSYPDYLQHELDKRKLGFRVANEALSGDTTSGGVERIPLALAHKPAIVVLELGGNDGLRGLPVAVTRVNLEQMITAFQGAHAKILLAGITLPRNYGDDYIRDFEKVYTDLAVKYKLPFLPFLLEGVAMQPGLMQEDGIHPTAAGNEKVAATVYNALRPLLQ